MGQRHHWTLSFICFIETMGEAVNTSPVLSSNIISCDTRGFTVPLSAFPSLTKHNGLFMCYCRDWMKWLSSWTSARKKFSKPGLRSYQIIFLMTSIIVTNRPLGCSVVGLFSSCLLNLEWHEFPYAHEGIKLAHSLSLWFQACFTFMTVNSGLKKFVWKLFKLDSVLK